MEISSLVLLAVSAITAYVARRRGAHAWTFGAGAFTVLFGWALIRQANPLVVVALVVVALAIAWQRWGRSSAIVTRWGSRARKKSGVASSVDIARFRGAVAMRRRAGTVRPSLRLANRRARLVQLFRLPVVEVAVELCRTGRKRVWAAIEDVVLVFGGPRSGKTQWLAGRVLDAPGAVVVTSTRTDLLDQTGPLRAEKGPVYVFNPVGLGGRESTITFDPLTGCTDPVVAAERATDMLGGTGHGYQGASGDREFWDDQGRRNLAALMHAAALGRHTMDTVYEWLTDPDESQLEITRLLRGSTEPAFVASITQFIETNDRTRTSITATIAPALGWLTHGPARAAALPLAMGGVEFDVEQLLDCRASIYMLGGEEAQVAPLVCALTGHIAREARRLAAFRPGGRLDPPLGLRLDECALICTVPLHQWTADMGGRGVSIVACFQSRAQLVDRYGEAKAATIVNNSGARVLFGGTADRDDLIYWSTMAGDRDESIKTVDVHGRTLSRSLRRVPVLAPSQIATLPTGRVVVFTRDMAPVIGRAEQAWRRQDVHTHHNPEALTVRARVWLHGRRRATVAWLSRTIGPAYTAYAARCRAADDWIYDRLLVVWKWCTARWQKVVGRNNQPAPFVPPEPPRLYVVPPQFEIQQAEPVEPLPEWMRPGGGEQQ